MDLFMEILIELNILWIVLLIVLISGGSTYVFKKYPVFYKKNEFGVKIPNDKKNQEYEKSNLWEKLQLQVKWVPTAWIISGILLSIAFLGSYVIFPKMFEGLFEDSEPQHIFESLYIWSFLIPFGIIIAAYVITKYYGFFKRKEGESKWSGRLIFRGILVYLAAWIITLIIPTLDPWKTQIEDFQSKLVSSIGIEGINTYEELEDYVEEVTEEEIIREEVKKAKKAKKSSKKVEESSDESYESEEDANGYW